MKAPKGPMPNIFLYLFVFIVTKCKKYQYHLLIYVENQKRNPYGKDCYGVLDFFLRIV
jgi:hypothetical protein